MTTPYEPVTFTSELASRDKMNKLANNTHWLFENTPRLRYSVEGLTRDTGLKLLSGKVSHPLRTDRNFIYVTVHFGNFFTVNCKPVITTGYEGLHGGLHKNSLVIAPLSGLEVDHTGFVAIVSAAVHNSIEGNGWVHYQALGY